jgi:hypothetical protein
VPDSRVVAKVPGRSVVVVKMRRRSAVLLLGVGMFSVGVLLPGFVLFGWTRNSRELGDAVFGSLGLIGGNNNGTATAGPSLTAGEIDFDDDELGASGGSKWEEVIILGESERGRDPQQNVTAKRDFIKQVGWELRS